MLISRVDDGLPIKMWLTEIENEALTQAENLSRLPFAFKHIAIMPDSHTGYGMPIGGVLATRNVIIPNAVGVDIGCGMIACMTSLKVGELDRVCLMDILNKIRQLIPVGFNKHNYRQFDDSILPTQFHETENINLRMEMSNAILSLGTLGGGNHFIEIQFDRRSNVWIMIHSGSRSIGKIVADRHNNIAKSLNLLYYSSVPSDYNLAFLPLNSKEGISYFSEMKGCVEYAYLNRNIMMDKVYDAFREVYKDVIFGDRINIHHNYAAIENHFKENVVVHRKGATSAKNGEIGIIPGSQGTCSYIVKGLGNPDSFMSCSHGSGRILSRSRAKRELNLEDQQKLLDDRGIIHSLTSVDNLDEAPGAYKDIDEVMDNQKDLVEIIVQLNPLAVIKG